MVFKLQTKIQKSKWKKCTFTLLHLKVMFPPPSLFLFIFVIYPKEKIKEKWFFFFKNFLGTPGVWVPQGYEYKKSIRYGYDFIFRILVLHSIRSILNSLFWKMTLFLVCHTCSHISTVIVWKSDSRMSLGTTVVGGLSHSEPVGNLRKQATCLSSSSIYIQTIVLSPPHMGSIILYNQNKSYKIFQR